MDEIPLTEPVVEERNSMTHNQGTSDDLLQDELVEQTIENGSDSMGGGIAESSEKPPTMDEETSAHDDEIAGPSRRLVRRVHMQADMDVVGDSDGRDTHVRQGMQSGTAKRVYVRRRRTPEEIIAMEHEAMQMRVPGAPGKRGRRSYSYVATEPISRTEAARRTGRPTVVHPSGVEFAIPISLEAHPIPLSDTIPDNADYDILRDDKGLPYCTQCHCVLKSWHAMDYHIMNVHLKYRPYRCMFCVKEYFYTEEECQSHLRSAHAGKPLHFIRELIPEKEEEANKFYQATFAMIREGDELSDERVVGIQQTAYNHMQKFHRMRFKVPEVVARQRSQRDATAQTFVTMAAPQTLVTAPVKSTYARDHMDMRGGGRVVRIVTDGYEEVMPDHSRYVMEDRDMEVADDGEYDHDQIDVVDHELGQAHPNVHYH